MNTQSEKSVRLFEVCLTNLLNYMNMNLNNKHILLYRADPAVEENTSLFNVYVPKSKI